MSLPLLSTKFTIPDPGTRYIRRPRLLEHLDEGFEQGASLILVSGPAGYGKTRVAGDWLLHSPQLPPGRVAWLMLESMDDDLILFLTYLITAVQRIHPGFGTGVLKMLETHKPPGAPALATLLINELSEIPGRFILALDDFHLLTAEPIHTFIAFLIDHQPAQLCLVLVTRSDPALPLARMRARGQLVELRQDALRFLPDEVAAYANDSMGLDLNPEELAFLVQHTEGWISGLQLAAISLRNAADRAAFFQGFSGAHKFIADYLTDDVLAGLSEPLRAFLLQTSILERLTAPLCAAVTGQAGVEKTLAYLVENNLFIVPLDSTQTWFRYHTLFADLLHKRLVDAQGTQVSALHQRASAWFEANALTDRAIAHAIAGQDFDSAARLLETVAEGMLLKGQAASLLRWMAVLPNETVLRRPVVGALKGFALLFHGRHLDAAIALIQELTAAGTLETIPGEAATLQALMAILQGKAADAIRLSEQAIRLVPDNRFFFKGLAADSLGMAYTLAGDYPSAEKAFSQVADFAMQSGNVMMALMALTNLAGLHYAQGRLGLGIHTSRQVVDLASSQISRQTPLLGKTLFNLGEMLREQGDLEAALNYLDEAASMMETFSEIGLPLVWLAIARIKIFRHDWEAAQALLDRARQRAQASQSTFLDDRLVDVLQARFWISRGELEPVSQWAARVGFIDRPLEEVFQEASRNMALNELFQAEAITMIRLHLAHSRLDQAVEMLDFLLEKFRSKGQQRRLIEIQILRALALHRLGNLDQALQSIAQAMTLAAPEGYKFQFISEGEPMAQLLYQAAARDIFPAFAGELLAAITQPAPAQQTTPPAGRLVEPLSDREVEVLQLVASGLTNHEIAARLFITLSTVKGHTANIFSKLGVKNRTQAVASARELGIL